MGEQQTHSSRGNGQSPHRANKTINALGDMTSALVCSVSCMYPGTKLKEEIVPSHPPYPENLPFCRAKTVVQSIPAGLITGPRIIGELLLLKKTKQVTEKNFRRATSDAPKNLFSFTFTHYKQTIKAFVPLTMTDIAIKCSANPLPLYSSRGMRYLFTP